jgi:hypothetical protein
VADYRTHRDKRAVILTLQRVLLDQYMEIDGKEPTHKVVSEQAPQNEAIVSQGIIVDVMSDLTAYEAYHHAEMLRYSWRKGESVAGPLPGLDPEPDRETNDEPEPKPKKPRRKRKKSEPPPEGSGDT